mmetsp:Transcript_41036/g.97385  ORF Transcript_41036/g.97385 Transcript_41036/m.97385 type:complete len:88 (-) Transcript_41036:546-809(-)
MRTSAATLAAQRALRQHKKLVQRSTPQRMNQKLLIAPPCGELPGLGLALGLSSEEGCSLRWGQPEELMQPHREGRLEMLQGILEGEW